MTNTAEGPWILRGHNMASLDRIQQLLNTSGDYQTRFLQDPVTALAQEGLLLSFEMQQDLRQQLGQAKAGRGKRSPRKEFIVFKLAVVLTTTL